MFDNRNINDSDDNLNKVINYFNIVIFIINNY